jgi:predicted Holliday junction resolvase-like endonuclease
MTIEAILLVLAAIAWAATFAIHLSNRRALCKHRELLEQIDREADHINADLREARAERRTAEAIHAHTERMIRDWIAGNDAPPKKP